LKRFLFLGASTNLSRTLKQINEYGDSIRRQLFPPNPPSPLSPVSPPGTLENGTAFK
jgi:hypothetical protein